MVETGTTMHNRLRLLRLITALLYSGPLLAGLMGQGWAMVAAFACVFVIFSVVLHPEHWHWDEVQESDCSNSRR